MHTPNPMDAWTNPVRFWTDTTLMQMEMMRASYELACAFNPFLPEGLLAGEVGIERGERDPAPNGRARRTTSAQSRPAPQPVPAAGPEPAAESGTAPAAAPAGAAPAAASPDPAKPNGPAAAAGARPARRKPGPKPGSRKRAPAKTETAKAKNGPAADSGPDKQ